ncbi:sulfotransferase family protein [Pseudoroseicyclus tamaricis]|uniref:Sulfotransferase n=1 Tax=Pseudoroseicyclus tamaricis TaxID=2705421 RepID=A0A6B2K0X4_9RHOB|nr:sulfotransferase [Pseudoroseicyclus tamaricis]NDV01342.1 sulfotransferase [Pseudoroseicyclus tamaricis]
MLVPRPSGAAKSEERPAETGTEEQTAPARETHEQRYIFIGGLDRGSLALIERCLVDRSVVATLRPDLPEREGQYLQDVVPNDRERGGLGRFALDARMHTPPAPPTEAERQRRRLLECWGPSVVGEADILVEKSAANLVRIPWLRSLFPGARFVMMTRDPRVVAVTSSKEYGASVDEMLINWGAAYAAAWRAKQEGLDDCIFLRHEDLRDAPEEVVDRLIAELGLPLRPDAAPLSLRNEDDTAAIAEFGQRRLGQGIWETLGYQL